MKETPEEYWKRMQPEIDRRYRESMLKIEENVRNHPGPLEIEREAHRQTKLKHAREFQLLSAIVSQAARDAMP